MKEEFLFVEKYRPKKISDCILPKELKDTFQDFVNTKKIPNIILTGSSGVGKTTVARAMLEEIDAEYLMINASMYGNIDTLRTDILNFASSVSFKEGRKYVILDEADYLNPNSTQPALRNFMEEFSKGCGFIFTCNYKNKIIPALHSRCTVVEFDIKNSDKAKLAMCFMKRLEDILKTENIKYDRQVIAQVIQKYFPDWRRIINEIQRYSVSGEIDSGILQNLSEISISKLIPLIKSKNYSEMRNWLYSNSDIDAEQFFRAFYEHSSKYFKPESVPLLIVLINKYQYQHYFVADPEINLMSFLIETMVETDVI